MPATSLAWSRPTWLPVAVWPFDMMAVDVHGCAVAVSEVGRGPALLFYTGIGSFIWRDVMMRLCSDYRCIALDPPGIGASGPVARADATLRQSARAVTTVMDTLRLDQVTLVLHDTGGPPALAAAARHPERIRGIAAINTFAWRPSGVAFRGMLSLMGSSLVRRLSLATGALSRLTSTTFGVARHLEEPSRRAYRAGLQRGMSAFHDYLHDALTSSVFDDVARGLDGPLGRLPLLTIFGERNDPLGFQPRWKALFPGARQLVIPKGNHFPMCDAPDVVADQIRQWDRERAAATEWQS